MVEQRIERVTEAQRACLRLIANGFSIKEVAQKLAISPDAVNERLRLARRSLDVSTSRQAARILALAEGADAYRSSVDSETGVEERFPAPPSGLATTPDWLDQRDQDRSLTMRDVRAAFDVSPAPAPRSPLRHLVDGVLRDDLNARQTVTVIAGLVALILGAVAISLIAYALLTWVLFNSAQR